MGLAAKVTLGDTGKLKEELSKLADGILQMYKCIDAIKKGKLHAPQYSLLQGKQYYPVIVTLENWRIVGPTWQTLNDLVMQRLRDAGLPENWTETMPFTACNIREFESLGAGHTPG